MSRSDATLGEKNQMYFDDFAASTNRPSWIIDLANQINAECLARLNWIGIPTSPEDSSTDCNKKTYVFRLLDYACGEGTLSRGIFDYTDEAWGIDLSAGMVKSYNEQAAAFDIPARKKMFAVQGDLLATSANDNAKNAFAGKEWFDFDVAIMSMALHHVDSPEDAIKALVKRVKVGRYVVFIDWIADTTVYPEGHKHGDMPGKHTTTTEGFGQDEMEKMLVDAGCEDVGFAKFPELSRLDFGEQTIWRRLFLAKGKKSKTGV
ncbi:MAG: hypothetical protein Q9166_002854 [cf. Caloplaca sp. 2 TL-2023]